MHTLLFLSSVLLVVLGSYVALSALRRLAGWSWRRDVQFWILMVPTISVGLGIGALYHFVNLDCFTSAPGWDYALGMVLPLGIGMVALGGVITGFVRIGLMYRMVSASSIQAGAKLRTLAQRQALQLGISQPRVWVYAFNRPFAFVYGLWRPTVVLSTWMIQNLDEQELEAVMAHELGHVTRHDYLVIWLATMLRDAFFYLPTSWTAYRHLQREKEFACDDLAVGITNRPLALASALAKAWQQASSTPTLGLAQPLAAPNSLIERRIERLLAFPQELADDPYSRTTALGTAVSAFIGLLVLEAINVAVMLAPMGCGPASFIAKLFS